MRLDAWKRDVHEGDRVIVPDNFPLFGVVDIDRPISDWSQPNDPLIGLLPTVPTMQHEYAPSVWGYDAYAKSFEKFFYAEPVNNIKNVYPKEWRFASRWLLREYSYLKIPM